MYDSEDLFILGSSDVEMSVIERVLSERDVPYAHATKNGRRVQAHNAYQGDGPILPPYPIHQKRIYLVECSIPVPDTYTTIRVDHHRPGDPGYGKPPEEFLPASSIGQVIAHLAHNCIHPFYEYGVAKRADRPGIHQTADGWAVVYRVCDKKYRAEVPEDILLTAAADHCLGAAYRGECHGVDPEELRKWRTSTRAKFQRKSFSEVWALQEAALRALDRLPVLGIAGYDFLDARATVIPELPEAAGIAGKAVVYRMESPGGLKEGVLNGTPGAIQAWMDANKFRLRDVYGDPMRGFAGGYILED